MAQKASLGMMAFVIALAAGLFLAGFACRSLLFGPNPSGSLAYTADVSALFERGTDDPRTPVRLRIPVIGVDAAIEQVGITAAWSMEAPQKPGDAGWFSMGPRPGETGSSIIAGHYGWKNGIPAAFDRLHSLVLGDKIFVEDRTGTTTVFVVREIRVYGESDDASAIFGSSDGKAHLNLITCEGVWNKASKSYSGRLVVFTDKE
jgi:sortase (surface protein transpeptidase)